MSDSGYGRGSLCSGCLHHHDCHILKNGFYHCSVCFKPCEPNDFMDDLKGRPKVIIDMNNKVRIELPNGNGRAKKIEPAPMDVTGQ